MKTERLRTFFVASVAEELASCFEIELMQISFPFRPFSVGS